MNLWHIVPNLDQLSVSVQQNTSTDYAGVDMRRIGDILNSPESKLNNLIEYRQFEFYPIKIMNQKVNNSLKTVTQ